MQIIDTIANALNIGSGIVLFSVIVAVLAIGCVLGFLIYFSSTRIIKALRKHRESHPPKAKPRKEKQKKESKQPKVKQKAEKVKKERSKKDKVKPDPSEKARLKKERREERRKKRKEGKFSEPVQTEAPAVSEAEPVAAEETVEIPVEEAPVQEVPVEEPPVSADTDPNGEVAGEKEQTEEAEALSDNSTQEQPDKPAAVSVPEDSQLSSTVDAILARRGKKAAARNTKNTQNQKRKDAQSKRRSSKALKQKAKKLQIPKTAQDTIPYLRVYPDTGIIETEQGEFTKSYLLDDVNYQVAKDEEQTAMFLKYAEFMNAFDPSTRFQITVNQKNINLAEFEAETMLPLEEDGLDHLRVERNDLLRAKIREGKNELVKEKYLTVSTHAQSYEAALTVFGRLDSEIIENIKKVGGAVATPLSSAKRLEILHDIYNPDSVGLFGNNTTYDAEGNLVFKKDRFRFDIMRRMGLTTKDMIAPESFSFKSDYGMVGQKYFRALFLRTLPQSVKDVFLKDLTYHEANMITSLIYQPIDGATAIKMARQDIVNVNANMIDKQKQASKSGYSVELINPELRAAAEEANALRDDLTRKNQKLFYMTFVIVHFADSKEQLDSDTKSIQAIGRRHLVGLYNLSWQQENALDSVLPLCNNKLKTKRSLTTESCAVFMPFVNQELHDRDGGMYYGNNAVSNNLILFNRRNCKNGNGFILGTSGSGKSMSAKQEMMTVLLSSKDDVIVIDPEGEYLPMAKMLDGEVIEIGPGKNNHINPFDIDLNCDGEDDPITIKSDFITSLLETVIGDRFGLTAGQKSLIDRCVKEVYKPYLNSLDPETGLYDQNQLPTLKTFYELLRNQHGYDALQLSDSLELYVTGSQNLFAFPTNVEYSKRFVVYDIKEIGQSMKTLGLLVVLDNIWNRIVASQKLNKNTWFFIDEIWLLFKNESSAEFLKNLYKRARKYGGIPTGITQNVTELLENSTARIMLSNCEYIQMLNQAPLDRATLGELLNISPTQMGFITNASPGSGLIYDGTHIVPFSNKLPKETMQYQAMTTNVKDAQERDKLKQEEAEAVSRSEASDAYVSSVSEAYADAEAEDQSESNSNAVSS